MLDSLIQDYGYWMILIGTFLEGETALILGLIAAYGGLLELPGVLLSASLGGFSGDMLYFYLGRRHGSTLMARYRSWEPRVNRMRILLHRYHMPMILAVRFMYGIRTAALIAMGLSSISPRRFALLSACSVALWALVVSIAVYLFGEAISSSLAKIKHLQLDLLSGAAVTLLAVWVLRSLRRQLLVKK